MKTTRTFPSPYKIPKKSSEKKSTDEKQKKIVPQKPNKPAMYKSKKYIPQKPVKTNNVQTNATNILGEIMKSFETPPLPHPDSQIF